MDPQNEYMDGYMIYSSYIQMTTIGPRQLNHECSLNGVFFFFRFCVQLKTINIKCRQNRSNLSFLNTDHNMSSSKVFSPNYEKLKKTVRRTFWCFFPLLSALRSVPGQNLFFSPALGHMVFDRANWS